jgi:hypothetical protein
MASFSVGDGHRIFFWTDRWIDGYTAEEIAPRVVERVPTRRKNIRMVAEAMRENDWLDDLEGEMTGEIWEQCLRLWEAVETVERDESRPDRIGWKGSVSGEYSAKATYQLLCQGSTRWSMSKLVWRSFAPMKCKIFAWLALKYRLWTSDMRARHGLQEQPDTCFTCLQEEDNVNHILAQCPYARQVWCEVLQSAGLSLPDPGAVGNLESWWTEARKRIQKRDRRRFDSMVISTAWSLWKQRNVRAFGNEREKKTLQQTLVAIKEDFQLWERARRGGRDRIARE